MSAEQNRPHTCGRGGASWSIFSTPYCMPCAMTAAASGERGGWTRESLAAAIAELRIDGRYEHGIAPEQQDVDRANDAFDRVAADD